MGLQSKKMAREAREYGKKVLTHQSRALPGQVIKVDVRLNDRGQFSAKYGETWHKAKSLPELQHAIDAAIAKEGPREWAYYIEISEIDTVESSRSEHWKRGAGGRAKIVMHYRVVQLSNEIEGADGVRYRIVRAADVAADGTLTCDETDTERYRPFPGETLLPYTPARYAALTEIARTINEVGRRLQRLLGAAETATALLARTDAPVLMLSDGEED